MKEIISKLVKLGSKIDFDRLVALDLVLLVWLHYSDAKLIKKNREDINALSKAVEIKKEAKNHE